MIETGIIRRIDEFGRIVIPKEVRKNAFGTGDVEGMPMEISYSKDGIVFLKPYKPDEDSTAL